MFEKLQAYSSSNIGIHKFEKSLRALKLFFAEENLSLLFLAISYSIIIMFNPYNLKIMKFTLTPIIPLKILY